jgi:hypothetical protein
MKRSEQDKKDKIQRQVEKLDEAERHSSANCQPNSEDLSSPDSINVGIRSNFSHFDKKLPGPKMIPVAVQVKPYAGPKMITLKMRCYDDKST